MSYYLRFFGLGKPLDVSILADGVSQIDARVAFGRHEADVANPLSALIWFLDAGSEPALLANLEINVPGDGLFEDEIEEFLDFAADGEGQRDHVIDALQRCTFIVAIQCLFGDQDTDVALDRLGPVLTWLNHNLRGFSQADGEGFYLGHELVLKLE